MKQKSGPGKAPAEQILKEIRRQTRRQYSAEEKIRIVLEGLRGEENISELCRREGIAASMYYGWSKEFLEAGKRRLAGDKRFVLPRYGSSIPAMCSNDQMTKCITPSENNSAAPLARPGI
jgi:transposase-like protein